METFFGRRGLRLIVLSNFAGQTAEALRRQREQEYEQESEAHRMRLEAARQSRDRAWSEAKRFLSRLELLEAWRSWRKSRQAEKDAARILARMPVVRPASIEEEQARAGDEAERRLDEFLSEALGENWTLIAGYHGRGGEIDRILVGPWGVYAFEIKGNRGVFHSDGARWWVEKFDRCGKALETKALPRSPDAQLVKAAGSLQRWLKRNGIDERITKVVLFTAEDACLGRIERSSSDWVATLRGLDLGRLFDPASRKGILGAATCKRVVRLILEDHAFWERQRQHPARRRSVAASADLTSSLA